MSAAHLTMAAILPCPDNQTRRKTAPSDNQLFTSCCCCCCSHCLFSFYPPPTKWTISIRSSSCTIVLLHSLRRTTARLSSIAIRAAGRSSWVINSAKEGVPESSLLSPFMKTRKGLNLISNTKAPSHKLRITIFVSLCLCVYPTKVMAPDE